ncbi:uncharacterized protein [Typha latifolia]|uniref:uncharacterized protein n=1 Tax=Typha latifolia TaxID=4733 RepID=UPI003C2B25B1
MSSPNIRDLLTSFSPSLDFFAITGGDGRIKIWDTVKGQLQTEFADISPSTDLGLLSEAKRGHLSLDYTYMKWVQLESKKKRKAGGSLLVLGTGSGDVLALDVSAGQLRWKVNDCHPGGVTAVSFSVHRLCIYTAGVDGMVCQIDTSTGSLLGRFKSSTKAISSLSISSDGKMLATAAGQLKTFNCSNNKKIQKFSGHPVSVRCMIFSEDGQHILSSGVGERYVAIWKIGRSETRSASCILSMEHPAIFLDSKRGHTDGSAEGGLYVLAISEMGVCYFWHGSSIDDLRNRKATKITLSESSIPKVNQGFTIFAAKLQGIVKPDSGQVLLAYGSIVKPSFEKILVQYGTDINMKASNVGVLLQMNHSAIPQKGQTAQMHVTALDRANAEDAILPLPKLYAHDKKRKGMSDAGEYIKTVMADQVSSMTRSTDKKVILQRTEDDDAISIEDKMREFGILGNKVDLSTESGPGPLTNYSLDINAPTKKMRAHILSMNPSDAYQLLRILVSSWKTRSASSKLIIPWIYCLLVNHGRFILSQDSSSQMLDDLQRMMASKCAAAEHLLKLSGRFQLITAQIDKAGKDTAKQEAGEIPNEGEDEDEEEEEEDVDELVYGQEEESSESSDDAEEHLR